MKKRFYLPVLAILLILPSVYADSVTTSCGTTSTYQCQSGWLYASLALSNCPMQTCTSLSGQICDCKRGDGSIVKICVAYGRTCSWGKVGDDCKNRVGSDVTNNWGEAIRCTDTQCTDSTSKRATCTWEGCSGTDCHPSISGRKCSGGSPYAGYIDVSRYKETCNNADDDCDGQIDEGVKKTYYIDSDRDGYGTATDTREACSAPSGFASKSGDCDDNNAAAKPGTTEKCNGFDDDCDGVIDEGYTVYYRDADGDGYGNPLQVSCSAQSGYILNNQDCNDSNSAIKPGVAESCNNADDDCNGQIDEDLTSTAECSQFGICAGAIKTCTAGSWSECSILPQAEGCDDIDDDCDGVIDNNREADNCSRTCTVVLGKVWLGTKCCGDEANEANPYETNETSCGDGKDNDCDGFFDMEDRDCDPTLPEIKSLSHSPEKPVTQQETSISTTVFDVNLNSVKLYVGQNLVKECVTEDTCMWDEESGYAVGNYYYNSWASDKAGNYIVSEIKSFAVRGDIQKTCAENTFGEGAICKEREYCGPPGVFVNSKDGGNVEIGAEEYNELTAQIGIARCCTSGKCTSEYVMPKCESYPVNGVQYDPEIASCNGVDVAAEVESAELKCCSGAVIANFKDTETFNVYWSRQNSGHFKLREAAEGDNLYCIASAKEGNENVLFEVRKGDNTETKSTKLINGYATVQKTADKTGTYVCTATMAEQTKSSEIKVTEAGIDPTKLPFFGAIQFVITSLLIVLYYLKRK